MSGAWNIARVGNSVLCTSEDDPPSTLLFSVPYAVRFAQALLEMSSEEAVDQLDRLLLDD